MIQKASEAGILTRQELVSMIPPLLLDIKKSDLVLDMCAAPGSKTGEMIELMNMDCEGDEEPTGAVVANDMDLKRAYMLTHQIKRINRGGMAVINHEGQKIPSIVDKEGKEVKFDKILVDVPCSGDGAIRKLPARWRFWSTSDGISLHRVQMQLFRRAIELCKVGGKVVYSTCSLNPIENEAVITAVLKMAEDTCPGAIQMLDTHALIPNVQGRKGLHSWFVAQSKKKGPLKTTEEEHSFDELFTTYPEYSDELHVSTDGVIKNTMFPLPKEEMEKLGIEKSMRIMPHDQNTGGFFIAVFNKTKEFTFPDIHLSNKEKRRIEDQERAAKRKAESKIEKQKLREAKGLPPKLDR